MKPILINIQIGNIKVDPGEILSILGGQPNENSAHTMDIIGRYTEECLQIASPRGAYARFKATVPELKDEIEIEGHRFHTGRIIRNMLKGAQEYAFFAATAGPGPENLSKKLINERQFLEGYIVDLIATGIVESVADQLQEQIKSAVQQDGLKSTNRYSPGYCTWNLDEQQKLFGLLPGDCCGITLSESSLMLPIKSVSGIIGIGKKVKFREHTCEICSMKECAYRRIEPKNPVD